MANLPGAIHFVAETPLLYLVGLGKTVFAAQIAPFCSLIRVAVFDESGSFFRSAGAKIKTHQWLSADGFAPGHEFIGAKLIGVDGIPRFIEHSRTAFLWTDSIQPVVAGDEIAPGISDDGNSHLTYFTEHVFAKAVGVRELRAWLVDALVDRAAKVL